MFDRRHFLKNAILLLFSVNTTAEFRNLYLLYQLVQCTHVQCNFKHQMMFCKNWSAADEIVTPTSWQYQMSNLWLYTWCMNILHVNMFQYMFCKDWSAADEIMTPTSWQYQMFKPSFTFIQFEVALVTNQMVLFICM